MTEKPCACPHGIVGCGQPQYGPGEFKDGRYVQQVKTPVCTACLRHYAEQAAASLLWLGNQPNQDEGMVRSYLGYEEKPS